MKKTDAESDVDCGGACVAKCSTGKKCVIDGDCGSTACGVSGVCALTHCDDGKLSGDESDVDCGGGCKTQCLVTAKCKVDGDCFSGACDGKSLLCVANKCVDDKIDQGESDVDCGGPCKPCAIGQLCGGAGDCNSKACSGNGGPGEVCDLCAPANTCTAGKCALVQVKCPDDGNACTVETCDAKTGNCSAPAKNCDDGNVCTNDSCDPVKGCVLVNNTLPCPDGDVCTLNETCGGGVCKSAALNCDDNNACTNDVCGSPTQGCVHQAVADTNLCAGGGICWSGTCCPGSGSITFDYSGGPKVWAVPVCAVWVEITAIGAWGGYYPGCAIGDGGQPAYVRGLTNSLMGHNLVVEVGGKGAYSISNGQVTAVGGYPNGGGNSGMVQPGSQGPATIGGGGMSAVQDSNTYLAVGAGGGGGTNYCGISGGAGGQPDGAQGGGTGSNQGPVAGKGGTQSAGGAGGVDPNANAIANGGLYAKGGEALGWGGLGGGGGGGGLYGGGGGTTDCGYFVGSCNTGSFFPGGGGGGSSYAAPTMTNVVYGNGNNVYPYAGVGNGYGRVILKWWSQVAKPY